MKKEQTSFPDNKILLEVAWEVCNQVGGIYTVIRSKVPEMVKRWGNDYLLLGPYVNPDVSTDFEPAPSSDDSIISRAVDALRKRGMEVHYGSWLVSGRPQTVLFDPESVMHDLGNIKFYFWQNHKIDFPNHDPLVDQVMAFGYMVKEFIAELAKQSLGSNIDLVAHFHEWMAGTAIPDIRREQIPVRTVFTTHATMLGRYLAMNDPLFYDHLPFLSWEEEAKKFNIESIVKIERACAHGAHAFTTVSDVTGQECAHLLGRKPDHLLPNGLNIDRFSVPHEVQNVHQKFKQSIHRFVTAHFFQSYTFDLDKTLYFFSSGRFEYENKGYDLTLEALARLNWKLKEAKSDVTVVMFFITRQPTHSINPDVLNSRAVLREISNNVDAVVEQVRERLFQYAATNSVDHRLPNLNDMVDDYWRLRYRRTIQSWKTDNLPGVVTHNLVNDETDPLLGYLRKSGLVNNPDDKVKIVYHPDFISSTNPLFGIEYGDFVRGCHLGVFPSYYEPWGYTPVECLASGVPAVTSDLAGFGDYVKTVPLGNKEHGMLVLERSNRSFDDAAEDLSNMLMEFVQLTRKERIDMRNKSEDLSEYFDWKNLYKEYEQAYKLATQQ